MIHPRQGGLVVLAALSLSGCRGCREESSGAPIEQDVAAATQRDASSVPRVLGSVPGPISALATGRGILCGVSRSRGSVFALSLSDEEPKPREIATGEREPFAVVVRGSEPVWASRTGVFSSHDDGGNRTELVKSDQVRALGAGPHDILFSDDIAIWRLEWPQAKKPVRVVSDASADEVVGTEETIAWIEHGSGDVFVFDLKATTRRQLAAHQRKPHDLAVAGDGHSVSWHEGEADLLPGREPRAYLSDTVTGAIHELAGEFASSAEYRVRGPCVFGPGVCRPVALVGWTPFGTQPGEAPVTDDGTRLYWVESADGGLWRIVSSLKASCCH
jgi:hypothetical protein